MEASILLVHAKHKSAKKQELINIFKLSNFILTLF